MKEKKWIIIILLVILTAFILYINYPKLYVATPEDRLQYCNQNFKDIESCQKAGCEWGELGGGAPLGQVMGCK